MSPIKSALVAFVLLGGFTGIANAAEINDGYAHETVRMSVADLNLDSDAGAKAFVKRADHAARLACGGRPNWQPLYFEIKRQYDKCHEAAMAAAVDQANSELVAYYAGKTARVTVLASR